MTDPHISHLRLVGGRLCLDFVNTANWSESGEVLDEWLQGIEDVKAWMDRLGLSRYEPPKAVEDLRDFRALVRRAVLQADGRESGIARLNESVRGASGQFLPARPDGGGAPADVATLVELLSLNALALLSDERELRRVKLCPGPRCGWLFLDETKNARRKWCSMATCGNRQKARLNYQRRREGASQ